MKEEILPEIRNKLTAPKIALEKLAKGESVPVDYLKLAVKSMNEALKKLDRLDKKIKKELLSK